MPRVAKTSIDQIIHEAIADVVSRASASISKIVAQQVAAEFDRNLAPSSVRRSPRSALHEALVALEPTAKAGPSAAPKPSRTKVPPVTKWVADRRARRVPNFVIEMTGLKTKKAIVAKFGEVVTFEKGKGLPKGKAA